MRAEAQPCRRSSPRNPWIATGGGLFLEGWLSKAVFVNRFSWFSMDLNRFWTHLPWMFGCCFIDFTWIYIESHGFSWGMFPLQKWENGEKQLHQLGVSRWELRGSGAIWTAQRDGWSWRVGCRVYRGFQSHGATPMAGWFISGKIPRTLGWFRENPSNSPLVMSNIVT